MIALLPTQSPHRANITLLLDGNAHRMIYPYIVNDRIDFNTIKELRGILDCGYDDPDHQGIVEREFVMLKQGTREFSAYFADFQRIMAELKWDPSATKAALRRGDGWESQGSPPLVRLS